MVTDSGGTIASMNGVINMSLSYNTDRVVYEPPKKKVKKHRSFPTWLQNRRSGKKLSGREADYGRWW